MDEKQFRKLTDYIWQRFSRAREMHFDQMFGGAHDDQAVDGYPKISTDFALSWAKAYFLDGIDGVRPRFLDPDADQTEEFVDGVFSETGKWIGWNLSVAAIGDSNSCAIAGLSFALKTVLADKWIDVFSERDSEQTLSEMELIAYSDQLDETRCKEKFSELVEIISAVAGPPVIGSERINFWIARMSRIEASYEFQESEEGQDSVFRLVLVRPRSDSFREDERLGARLRDYHGRFQRDM